MIVINNARTVSAHIDMTGTVTAGATLYQQTEDVRVAEMAKFGGDVELIHEHLCVSLNVDGSQPFFIPIEDVQE